MEKTLFAFFMDGLTIDEVVRDHEFAMPVKHFHDTYEVYFLLEGDRYYFIEKETYHVKTGEVVMVKRQQIHKTGPGEKDFHDRILLQMDGRALDPYLKSAGLPDLDSIFSNAYGVIGLNAKMWEWMRDSLLLIKKEMEEKRQGYEIMVRLTLFQILLALYRKRDEVEFARPPKTVQTAKHQKVHQVAEYLSAYCESDESLEEIGKRFYRSKSYLSRIFREVTGFSVGEYRNLARIKKGQKLLEYSDYSVTEIAELLGFESVTYFERVFKKLAATTPKKYRKYKRNGTVTGDFW